RFEPVKRAIGELRKRATRGRHDSIAPFVRSYHHVEAAGVVRMVVLKVERALEHAEVRLPMETQPHGLLRRAVLVPSSITGVVDPDLGQVEEVVTGKLTERRDDRRMEGEPLKGRIAIEGVEVDALVGLVGVDVAFVRRT